MEKTNEMIRQMIPLNDGHVFVMADSTGSRNKEWRVIGAALVDDGKILPVIYDGDLEFALFDMNRERVMYGCKKVLEEMEEKENDNS